MHATQGSATTPYLVNMSDDPALAGALVYYIPMETGPSTIGASKDNSIRLTGVGISDQLCTIENIGDNSLVLRQSGTDGRIVVDSRLAQAGDPIHLKHLHQIYLGRTMALKVMIPNCVRSEEEMNLILCDEGHDSEWSAVDQSMEWLDIEGVLKGMCAQMTGDEARALTHCAREAVHACTEANEITAMCRKDENIKFEVAVAANHRASVVIRKMENDEEDSVWSLPNFSALLDHMRDYLHSFQKSGKVEIKSWQDPWHLPQQHDIWNHIEELERKLFAATQSQALSEMSAAQAGKASRQIDDTPARRRGSVQATGAAAARGSAGQARSGAQRAAASQPPRAPRGAAVKKTASSRPTNSRSLAADGIDGERAIQPPPAYNDEAAESSQSVAPQRPLCVDAGTDPMVPWEAKAGAVASSSCATEAALEAQLKLFEAQEKSARVRLQLAQVRQSRGAMQPAGCSAEATSADGFQPIGESGGDFKGSPSSTPALSHVPRAGVLLDRVPDAPAHIALPLRVNVTKVMAPRTQPQAALQSPPIAMRAPLGSPPHMRLVEVGVSVHEHRKDGQPLRQTWAYPQPPSAVQPLVARPTSPSRLAQSASASFLPRAVSPGRLQAFPRTGSPAPRGVWTSP